jgi:hypothetical protein
MSAAEWTAGIKWGLLQPHGAHQVQVHGCAANA